jgi:hypothetical protein
MNRNLVHYNGAIKITLLVHAEFNLRQFVFHSSSFRFLQM